MKTAITKKTYDKMLEDNNIPWRIGKPIKAETLYFNHIHHKSGFDISKEFTEDGKDYVAPSTHACLRHGYWCWKNALERPQDLYYYLKRKIRR